VGDPSASFSAGLLPLEQPASAETAPGSSRTANAPAHSFMAAKIQSAAHGESSIVPICARHGSCALQKRTSARPNPNSPRAASAPAQI
jgi:hypothetical protein